MLSQAFGRCRRSRELEKTAGVSLSSHLPDEHSAAEQPLYRQGGNSRRKGNAIDRSVTVHGILRCRVPASAFAPLPVSVRNHPADPICRQRGHTGGA